MTGLYLKSDRNLAGVTWIVWVFCFFLWLFDHFVLSIIYVVIHGSYTWNYSGIFLCTVYLLIKLIKRLSRFYGLE